MMFRKNPTTRQSEVWFAGDIVNLLTSLDAVPLPAGDYAAGWANALEALAKAIGYERVGTDRAPMVWIIDEAEQIAGAGAALALPAGRFSR
jgi:hypothetical protein